MIACSLHTRTPAGWSCTGCGRVLCPACTGWRPAGHGRIEICMRCGALARRLRTHRSARAPFAATLFGALGWPISPGGIFTLCALALVLYLLQLSGGLGGLIGYGVALAYFFQVVRHTAAGHDDVPAPADFHGLFDDVLAPTLRALLASMWFVSPLVLWLLASGHSPLRALSLDEPIPLSPLPVAILLGGALLYPMSIIAGALNSPFSILLNPLAIVGLTFQLGRDYWRCSFFCLACSLSGALVTAGAGRFFKAVPIPFGGLVVCALSLYFPFVVFRALGLLVRARGDELGYGGIDSYRVNLLDQLPAHALEPPEARLVEEEAPDLFAPIELGPALHPMSLQGAAESAAELGTPIPLLPLEAPRPRPPAEKPSLELPAPPDPRLPSRLAQRMASGDLDGARAVLREGGGAIAAGTLSAKSWSELSRAFSDDAGRLEGEAKRALAELALLACRRAVEVAPEGALAPRSWLAAARICDEMLLDRPQSNRLLGELARRFPETPEGLFAARRLASTGLGPR